MLNSTSSSSSSSSSLSSSSPSPSSSVISSNQLPKPPPISSSPSSYTPLPSTPHTLHHSLPHPTLVPPHPLPHFLHHHHLHHLHTHDTSSPHCLFPLPQASIATHSSNSTASTNESFNSTSGIVSEINSTHNHGIDPHCYTTDCSPRSVIRHIHSSSSAPSPDPCRPSDHHTSFSTNACPPSTISTPHHHQATNLSIVRPQCLTLHDSNEGAFLLVHKQSDHRHLPPPWSSPAVMAHHHYYDVCSKSSSTHSGHIKYESGTEEGNRGGELRRSPKLTQKGGSKSADLHRRRENGHPKSGYVSGPGASDKLCIIHSNEAADYEAIKQFNYSEAGLRTHKLVNSTEAGLRTHYLDANASRYASTHPLHDSFSNSTQFRGLDHAQKIHPYRSFNCDPCSSVCARGECVHSRASSRQSAGAMKQSNSTLNEMGSKSPDALLHYVDGISDHDIYCNTKTHAQFGSKWEDAEKWVRPSVNHQYDAGCRRFPNLGLLRVSNCINSATAVKSQYINYSTKPVPHTILSSNYTANHSSAGCNCTRSSSTNCVNYGSASSSYSSASGVSADQPTIINHPSLRVHVDCFNPHVITSNPHVINSNPHLITSNPNLMRSNPNLISSNPYITYGKQFSPSPQLAKDLEMKGQLLKKRDEDQQDGQDNYTEKSREDHHAGTGSGIIKSPTMASRNYQEITGSMREGPSASGWNVPPLPPPTSTPHQLTDRFASGEALSRVTPQLAYSKDGDNTILIRPFTQENVMVSMVSLREVGTQISSIDGSGSISRYTSKNGSPRESVSPTRHNTPACMRSLSGSTNIINNIRHSGKQVIDLEELIKCHRAKLELQVLSEGERIHSFHRTTSNWSSREVEEADLSRSLRHSTELDEPYDTNKNHNLPSQSYSWKKDEDSKLAKLKLKEARIQAWEEKKKSKADAQLKRLEENLAKRRSQTTSRIMGSLATAQRKAEEMRASVYAHQRRPTKKAHRFRHRSLSPLSRCTCFSAFQ